MDRKSQRPGAEARGARDTRFIEVNKIVTVVGYFGVGGGPGSSSFTFAINNVSFLPDVVVVKSIYHYTIDTFAPAFIYSDLVSDYIGSTQSDIPMDVGLTFMLDKSVKGVYTFSIVNLAGALSNRSGTLTILLDFVKYKNVTEQKVY